MQDDPDLSHGDIYRERVYAFAACRTSDAMQFHILAAFNNGAVAVLPTAHRQATWQQPPYPLLEQ